MSERFDVVVAGGGTAGIAAALAAGQRGARTLLVEREPSLGGNATQAYVHTFCGLYLPADTTTLPTHANDGLPRRFAEELRRAGGTGEPERAGKVWVLPIFPPVLERVAAACCARVERLSCWTGATIARASLDDGGAELSIARAAGETVDVHARVVVDATGDAAVATLGAAATTAAAPDELQCSSFIFRIGGVARVGGGAGAPIAGFARLKVSVAAAGAVRHGELPAGCESVMLRPGAASGEVYVTLNMPKLDDRPFDPLDDAQRAALERLGRVRGAALVEYLQRTRPEFRDARVVAWPRRLGIRETRRVRGRDVVSADDVLHARRRDDEVALSTWPIELWDDHLRARFEYPAGPCSVPLGALVSATHRSLATAGRCMSATHEALGALRVIGTALATGEAAGAAAAIAADRDVGLDHVSPSEVRTAIATAAVETERA